MMSMGLCEAADILQGQCLGGDPDFSLVGTDTRNLPAGALFVALQGPNFDGHEFIAKAAERGACAAMVSRELDSPLPQLRVDDTRMGLGRLAAAWRQKGRARVVGITGSNGKTTLKEMVAAILREQGSVLATQGNLNNDIGLPLSLLRLQDEEFAVIEMGANHPGEIDYLTRIACPDVAVLNNAGRAHLEGFGSLEGVARAKAEIINGLAENGVFIYHADSPWAPMWRELAGARTESCQCLGFGLDAGADIRSPAQALSTEWHADRFRVRFPVFTPRAEYEITLNLGGEHNRLNALAAVAVAHSLDIDPARVQAGLEKLLPVRGRLCPLRGLHGSRLVDDSYNANPDSVAAAIAVLAAAPGRRVLVLGDLAELGGGAADLHAAIGSQAREAGIDELFCAGDMSAAAARAFGTGARHFMDRASLADALCGELDGEYSVLVKGSRSARMDEVVDVIKAGEGAAC